MRVLVAAVFALLIGCGMGDCPVTVPSPVATTPTPTPTPVRTQAPPPSRSEPESSKTYVPFRDCHEQILDADRIVHAAPARQTLYAWTTNEQVDALHASKLLFADAPARAPAVTAVLALLAVTTGKELAGEHFARTRATWPLAWPTRLDAPGNRLLRIGLRPEALVLTLWQSKLKAFDLTNKEVELETVIEHPERLGAIYFVHGEEGGYRQFFVGNEAMIEEWSVDTDAIRSELERERALLGRLMREKRSSLPTKTSTTWSSDTLDAWSNAAKSYPIRETCPELEGYRHALAFSTTDYQPTTRNLAQIIDTLDADAMEAQ